MLNRCGTGCRTMRSSCLSSRRLRKDVVDSLRPSRRSNYVVPHAHPATKKAALGPRFGGQPLPLPKPQGAGGSVPGAALSPALSPHPSARYLNEHDDDGHLVFTRTPLSFPPPPVPSPSSSGKCSPSASTAVASKVVLVQEHPSPAQNGVPPPPWSSSSSLSLNASTSPPMSPPAVLEITSPLLPVESVLPCPASDDGCSLQSSPLTSSSSSALRKHCSEAPLDSIADIRKEVKVFELHEIESARSDAIREHRIAIVGDVTIITGWIAQHDAESKRHLVAVVGKHRHSRQGLRDWVAKVNLISRVDDQHICKLQGYCGGSDEQMLVFEHGRSGSLSDYLFGSLCKALLNWRSRVRIALAAARALAYIHDQAPIEVVYNDFKSSSILLDLDFSVKLAGQGLDVIAWQHDKLNKAASTVMRKSEASCKSNIRSYGVFLLELLTGKSVAGEEFLNDDKHFTRWAKPYLLDQEQLASVIDPHLKRQFPCAGLTKVATLALQCLKKDPKKRPSISEVVDILDNAMALQPSCRTLNRSMNKCMSLRSFQSSPLKGFSRTLST